MRLPVLALTLCASCTGSYGVVEVPGQASVVATPVVRAPEAEGPDPTEVDREPYRVIQPAATLDALGIPLIETQVHDKADVFGFAWHDEAWAVGVAYPYPSEAVQLRAVGQTELGEPLVSTTVDPGYPDAILSGGEGKLPWLVFSEDLRFEAMRFDGSARHVALKVPDKHVSPAERSDWRGGDTVVGVSGWESFEVHEYSKAKIRRDHRRAERRAKRTGMHASKATVRRDAVRVRYRGRRGRTVQVARHPKPGPDVYEVAVSAGPSHWVGAHWEDMGSRTDVVLNLFDYPSRLRKTVRMPAPRGINNIVGAAPDGHSYLVADATSVYEEPDQLTVLAFDADAAVLGERRVAVEGWVAGTMDVVDCDGRTWLVFNDYSVAHVERLAMLPLTPEGPLPQPTVLWSRKDPRPGSAGSRPGRILLTACGPGRAAAAIQIQDKVHSGSGDVLVVAQWPTTAG